MGTVKKILLLILALVAIACSACQVPTYTGPQAQPRIAVVGDSITDYSTTALDRAFAKENRWIKGIPGIDLADGRTQLVQPAVASKPDVLVIELGINSAREVWNSADLTHLEGILRDTDSIACVIWVTPNALEPSYYDHLGKGTINSRIEQFQASLTKRLPANPNVRVADWGATEVQHPEWYDADRLHPNAAGQKAYAAFVLAQVQQGC